MIICIVRLNANHNRIQQILILSLVVWSNSKSKWYIGGFLESEGEKKKKKVKIARYLYTWFSWL